MQINTEESLKHLQSSGLEKQESAFIASTGDEIQCYDVNRMGLGG